MDFDRILTYVRRNPLLVGSTFRRWCMPHSTSSSATSQSPIDRVNLSEKDVYELLRHKTDESQSPIDRVNLSESAGPCGATPPLPSSQSPIDRVNLSEATDSG